MFYTLTQHNTRNLSWKNKTTEKIREIQMGKDIQVYLLSDGISIHKEQ